MILNLEKLILRTVDRRLSIICKYHKNKKVSASTTENYRNPKKNLPKIQKIHDGIRHAPPKKILHYRLGKHSKIRFTIFGLKRSGRGSKDCPPILDPIFFACGGLLEHVLAKTKKTTGLRPNKGGILPRNPTDTVAVVVFGCHRP